MLKIMRFPIDMETSFDIYIYKKKIPRCKNFFHKNNLKRVSRGLWAPFPTHDNYVHMFHVEVGPLVRTLNLVGSDQHKVVIKENLT